MWPPPGLHSGGLTVSLQGNLPDRILEHQTGQVQPHLLCHLAREGEVTSIMMKMRLPDLIQKALDPHQHRLGRHCIAPPQAGGGGIGGKFLPRLSKT